MMTEIYALLDVLLPFDWAHYTRLKGAIKLHTLLNFDTLLPDYMHITDGSVGDNTAAYQIELVRGDIVVCDRGYFDTSLFSYWDSKGVFFVVRVKDNMLYERIKELDLPDRAHPEVLIDEIVMLTGTGTSTQYAKPIRRIAVYNAEHGFTMELLTNNFKLAAGTIADLYRQRWKVETFFRTIKQNFHIKSFIGTSRNAVEIQIWTALITILLLAVLKQQATYKWHFSNLVSSLRLNTFLKSTYTYGLTTLSRRRQTRKTPLRGVYYFCRNQTTGNSSRIDRNLRDF